MFCFGTFYMMYLLVYKNIKFSHPRTPNTDILTNGANTLRFTDPNRESKDKSPGSVQPDTVGAHL